MKRLLSSVCLVTLAAGGAASAEPLPVAELWGEAGTESAFAGASLMLPYALSSGAVVFGDARAAAGEDGLALGSLGLGYRAPVGAWVLGLNAYYDYLNAETGAEFHQFGFGVEALGRNVEFRANAYLPFGDTSRYREDLNQAYVSGNDLLIRHGQEQALTGFDAEAGIRLPVFDPSAPVDLKVFGGGFAYEGDGIGWDAGVTARAELQVAALPALTPGSALTFGVSARHSDREGTDGAVTARLRVPFGRAAGRHVERDRLLRRVERAYAINTHTGTSGDTEAAAFADTGVRVGHVTEIGSGDGSTAPLLAADAGEDGLILATGSMELAETLQLIDGQRLLGGGGTLAVIGASSGARATFSYDAQEATITGADPAADVVAMANRAQVLNVALTGGRNGISAEEVSDIVVRDVDIDATGLSGIALFDVDGVLIENASITNLNDDEGTFAYADPYIDYASINAVGVRNATFRNIVADTARTGLFISSIWAPGDDPELDAPAIYSENISVENLTVSNTTGEAIFMIASRYLDFDTVSTFNAETPGYELDQFTILSSSDVTVRNLDINGGSNGIMVVSPLADVSQRLNFEDVTITGTGRAGIFLNGSDDVSFTDVRIVSPGTPTSEFTAAVYLYGDFITPVSNVTFDDVTVVDSDIPIVTPSGDLQNIDGDITGTGSDAECETFYYSLTQAPGSVLAVNGAVLPAGVQFGCP